jgi:hypothetical protein
MSKVYFWVFVGIIARVFLFGLAERLFFYAWLRQLYLEGEIRVPTLLAAETLRGALQSHERAVNFRSIPPIWFLLSYEIANRPILREQIANTRTPQSNRSF